MTQPSGWYDDPNDPALLRYWDGVLWSNRTMPKLAPGLDQSRIGLPEHTTPPIGTDPLRGAGQHPAGEVEQGRPSGSGGAPAGDRSGYGQYPPQGQPGPNPAYTAMPSGLRTPDGAVLSGWWRRVGAYLIDAFVVGIPGLVFTGYPLYRYMQVISDYVDQQSGQSSTSLSPFSTLPVAAERWLLIVVLISAVLNAVYSFVMLRTIGSTVGMLATGISVRLRMRPGIAPTRALTMRVGVVLVLGLLSVVPLIKTLASLASIANYLWPLWDSQHQALHDKVADTVVVRGRQARTPR